MMSRTIAKARSILRHVLPQPVRDFLWYWRSTDLRAATRAAIMVREQLGDRVLLGPFSGMKYIRTAVGSSFPPKLLGTYEKELWPLIDTLSGRDYKTLVDIGSAEGYYAVGFAYRFPAIQIIGFEGKTETHLHLRKLASLNGVEDRIDLRGLCTVESLAEAMVGPGPLLVISDCEGAEQDLLDPVRVPALAAADLLVEVHDFLVPGVSQLLRHRFESTHHLQVIEAIPRTMNDWPEEASFVPIQMRMPAMAEHRGQGQVWFFYSTKGKSAI